MQDFQIRSRVYPGQQVLVAVKVNNEYQPELHPGVVRDVLTNTSEHYRGIKVRLTDGTVGRIREIVSE